MAGILDKQRTEATDLKFVSPLELSSVTSTAKKMLVQTIEFCMQKIGVDTQETVTRLVRQKDRSTCGYVLYGLSKQVATFLGSMDQNVKAIFFLDYDEISEDFCFATPDLGMPSVQLIVWTRRKTAALSALIAALDRALAHAFVELFSEHDTTCLLDVQVVDDTDIENRTGHGANLYAIHHRPIQIWER